MRVIMLYRPNSEFARRAEEYVADFQRFHPSKNIETINVDSIDGAHIAKLYGVMEYPTVLALKDDGQMEQMWSGIDRLPLMNDLAYFTNQ